MRLLRYDSCRDNRIVTLSDTRQVIVFTHNIWFTTELLARFERRPQDCSYFNVARDGTKIGLVSKRTHPRSDTFSSLRGRINVLIQSAEKRPVRSRRRTLKKPTSSCGTSARSSWKKTSSRE
jgi:hypothetical protein